MNQSIYDRKDIKTVDKRFKSVFPTTSYTEDCLIVGVEAYDELGYNTLNTSVDRFDRFYNKLNKILLDNFNKLNPKTDKIRVIIYSDVYPSEYILTESGLRF